MEFYEVINRRRTIRDFSNDEVSINILKKVLDAGIKAPSNDHLRNWEFVVIYGKKNIEDVLKKVSKNAEKQIQLLAERRLTQDQKNMYADAMPKQYKMLRESGCLILPFYKQTGDLLKPEALNSLNAFAAIWCCIENILLAATAQGLACALRIPVGDEAEYVHDVINAPKEYIMPCYISIGYPAKNASVVKQVDIDVEQKMHFNKW